jgi:hypothetical protein
MGGRDRSPAGATVRTTTNPGQHELELDLESPIARSPAGATVRTTTNPGQHDLELDLEDDEPTVGRETVRLTGHRKTPGIA